MSDEVDYDTYDWTKVLASSFLFLKRVTNWRMKIGNC